MGELIVLRFHEDGYAPLEQHISIVSNIWPMHYVPSMESAALHRSSSEDEAFHFLTYLLLSYRKASYIQLGCIGQYLMTGTY